MKFDSSIVKGSLILLITINLFNVLNFFFQFSMVRLLTVSEYGQLAALFSLVYILAIFSESIQTVIAKYSSQEDSFGKIKNILQRSIRKSLIFSSVIFFIYILLSFPISAILKIHVSLVILNGVIIFPSFISPLTRGIMQGQRRFTSFGANLIIESFIKLILSVIFVFLGLKVYGALFGIISGAFIALLFSFYMINDILKSKNEYINTKGIYKYSFPVFSIMLIVLIFYTVDILIAKALFSEEIAGKYAIASILSKTIFWGTQPVSKALFPISASRKDRKDKGAYKTALIIILLIIGPSLLIVYLFPNFLINLFSGRIIPESASILFSLCLATAVLSVANLNLLQRLSTGRLIGNESLNGSYREHTLNFIIFFSFLIIEFALLFYFSDNIQEFSLAFLSSSIIFLIGSQFILWLSK
jgi:O-antigen/teichoic acid export membrane protein